MLFDPKSKRLDVASQRGLDLSECPYCHRPLRSEESGRDRDHGGPVSPGFVSPEYFRMLQDSLPGSASPSAPPSPRRRLVEPIRPSLRTRQQSSEYTEPYDGPTPSSSGSHGISASAFSQGYFQRFFKVEKELGRGGKGVVLLVTHVLDDVMLGQYACKRVPVGNDHTWLTNVLNEVRLLEHLSHHHLVYYKHVWLEDVTISTFGPSVPCVFILQQYCNMGDLHQYIIKPEETDGLGQSRKERARRHSKDHGVKLPELRARRLRFEEIYSFFKDITSGLNHLHVNGFIHRDLKPSNCLLHNAGQGPRVLVSDFGEVQVENMVRKSSGATGTVSYCAPEVLRENPVTHALGNFTAKSDIFSLGMILYFLCFARLPYRNADYVNEENEDLDLLREEIISWTGLHEERKLRPELPEQLFTFLRRLLSLEANDRPSAEEILLGIKTGSGLDEISDTRPNKASHIFDDLSASSRISPVDSPRPSTPTRRVSASFTHTQGQARNNPSKIRFPTFQREHSGSSSRPSTPASSSLPDQPDLIVDRSSDSLILRPPFPSPTRLISDPLNASNQQTRWSRLLDPPIQRSVKLGIFVLKALSLNMLCSPFAVRSSVLYVLLGIATLDFVRLQGTSVGLTGWGISVSAALAVLHVAILLGFRSRETLCLRPSVAFWN